MKVDTKCLEETVRYNGNCGCELFVFDKEGVLITGVVEQYEGDTVDVYVPYYHTTYEVPVSQRRSFLGCKLREIGDLSD